MMITTLVFFAAGLGLVSMAIALTLHLMHREPRLAARRAAVQELTHRPSRMEAARAEIARTRTELSLVTRQIEKIRERLLDWLPLEDTPGSAWRFFVVSALLGLLEAILFLLYGLGSGFGNAPPWLLALLSSPAAAITIVLMHVMLAAAFGSRHRPARTLRRARIGLVIGILMVLMAIWAVLGGRNLSDVATIEALTIAGLLSLASTTSLAGGFALLVGSTVMEERRLETSLARLESRKQALEEHLAVIAADLARLENATALHPSAGFAAPAGIVPVLLLAMLLGAKPSLAQSVPITNPKTAVALAASNANLPAAAPSGSQVPKTAAQAAVAHGVFQRAGACEVLLDLTTSVNPVARQQALARIREALPLIVESFKCRVLRIVPFSGSLLDDVTEVAIPPIVDPVIACQTVAPPPVTGAAHAAGLLYPTVEAARKERARVDCESRMKAQQQQQLAARRQALLQAVNALNGASGLSPRGNCTGLNLAVRRSLARAQHVLSLTDGINSCRAPAATTTIDKEGTLLFVIVPANHDSPDAPEDVFARMKALEAAFPGGHALLLEELVPSLWQMP